MAYSRTEAGHIQDQSIWQHQKVKKCLLLKLSLQKYIHTMIGCVKGAQETTERAPSGPN